MLIIGDLEQGVLSALAMNKMKGNIKVNVIDAPTYGVNKQQMLQDLSLLTGATIVNEDLGDDMEMIKSRLFRHMFKKCYIASRNYIANRGLKQRD